MTAAWVAGGVRARSMRLRIVGREELRAVAAAPTLEAAIERLAATAYGRTVHPGESLVEAQHAVFATTLWHLRVLAGWLPAAGARVARTLAGAWEIANALAAVGDGQSNGAPYDLGALATARRGLRDATGAEQVRAALARSAWGDPGTVDAEQLVTWMRVRWAERVTTEVPAPSDWAAGWLALLLARVLFAEHRLPPPRPLGRDVLGSGWRDAFDLASFRKQLPASAAWALVDLDSPADLWRAEAGWWARLERDAEAMNIDARPGRPEAFVASVALLAADGWRVRAALALAARAGSPMEAFDVVG